MRDISDGICAYIVGGLGNQLLILAAAWAQADRLGCPLYVDTSWYARPEAAREAEINDLDHPGIDITEGSPWASVTLLGQAPGLQTVDFGSLQLHLFTEQGFGYDPQINTVVPGTTIAGYYQSPKHFGAVAERFEQVLTSAALRPLESEYLDAVVSEPRTSLHVRRGDYLNPQTSTHHGIAEPGYYARATRLYEQLHRGSRYRIYTDSPEVAAGELADLAGAELAPPGLGLRPIAALRAMAASDGIVIGNSTFSWWAAWLITRRDADATVIAPRPWFRNGASASDLLLPDWITLDARN